MVADGVAIGSELRAHPLGVQQLVYRGIKAWLGENRVQIVAQGRFEFPAQHRIPVEFIHLRQGGAVRGIVGSGALVDGHGGRRHFIAESDGIQVEAGI